MDAGASFYLFDGGWICAAPRSETEVDLHIAALPGFRGPNTLDAAERVVGYLLDTDSPFRRVFAVVYRNNRAVRSMASAVGFKQHRSDDKMVEFVIERTA